MRKDGDWREELPIPAEIINFSEGPRSWTAQSRRFSVPSLVALINVPKDKKNVSQYLIN